MNIKTKRLTIRLLDMKDKESFYGYRSLNQVYKYQSWKPKNVEDARVFIENIRLNKPNIANTWQQYAISLDSDELIGDIGIHYIDNDYQIEIAYTLSPKYQGKGYATEALKAVIDYMFTKEKKHRISASVDPNNLKSIRLLERMSFRKEGHFLKSYRANNQWHDDCIYAILENEWYALK